MYPSTLLSFILNFIHFSVSLASFADSLGLSYYAPVVESSEVTHLVRKDPTHGNIDWNFLAPRDLWSRDDTGTCSDSTPCSNGACCSNSGYCGYSPDFCGTGNCTSNCDAKAECGEYAVEGSQDCPLNVCCSQYGFCGTTTDFCGTGCQDGYGTCGDVSAPSCSTSNSASKRSVAYYESWSLERPCEGIAPENLNLAGFTHANFAFVYFDPATFSITAMDATSAGLFSRFTALKSNYSNLETWVSVGGWSFSDPGSTETAWPIMASSSANRAAFIRSLTQFMKTYGFDGVDLDWEYPGASDRGGTDEDGDNFVSLVKEMRAAWGTNYGISVTLPTSYWYLQGFKPVEMETYVDWFNFMAYDLHGTWDATDIYEGPYIEPHTNLTEIDEGLQLLWRAGVSPGKVVLGEGWYGRSFTLANPGCKTPNGVCEFVSGGDPGACTATSGILSNAEIEAIIEEYGLTPTYDEDAAVNWITWDTTQWVSYDNNITLSQKKDFADANCLGGMMVWAVDLNNQSSQTGFGSQAYTDYSETTTSFANSKQVSEAAGLACYTSQCGKDCRAGYTGVTNMNGQPGSLSTNARCDGDEYETLCCASGTTMGTCTWRGWRGQGLACSGGCLSSETLVAQNTNHHDTVNGKTEDYTCTGGLQSYCCQDFKAASSLTSVDDQKLAQEDIAGQVVSVVVATITEAIADAAKTALDELATAFCDVAVPEFLAPIEAVELDIPIIGEIAIAVEDALIPEIIKGCEDAIEDAGDAVLSWLGLTTSLKLSSVTEVVSSTETEFYCSPDTCSDGCAAKRSLGDILTAAGSEPTLLPKSPSRTHLFSPAATGAAVLKNERLVEIELLQISEVTYLASHRRNGTTMADVVVAARSVPGYGNMNQPATGGLDAWFKKVWAAGDVWELQHPDQLSSTAEFRAFSTSEFYFGEWGMCGCTSLIMVSKYGAYMTHFWESPTIKTAELFQSDVIDELGTSSLEGMVGIQDLPDGYFNNDAETMLSVAIFTAAKTGSTDLKYPDEIAEIKTTVASYVDGLDASDIETFPYYTREALASDMDIAAGKILIHFDPDLGNGEVGYQVWVGSQYDGSVIAAADINSPIMGATWS